jgi:hypothetical protein
MFHAIVNHDYKPKDIQDLWNMPKKQKAFLYAAYDIEFEHQPK